MSYFQTQLAEEYARFPLTIIKAVSFTKPPGQDPTTYETTRAAFIFPIKGRARILFDSQEFLALPGMVIHGCPGKQLTFEVEGNEPFCHINLYYDPPESQTSRTDFIHSAYELPIADMKAIEDNLNELLTLSHCHDVRSRFRMNYVTQHLLGNLFCSEMSKKDAEELNFAKEAAAFLRSRCGETLTLNDAALHFQMKPEHFSYQFYKNMGVRPIDYLIQFRLETAAGLLRENGYTVKQAALSVGYKDEFYFSRLFKKHMGIPPSEVKNGK